MLIYLDSGTAAHEITKKWLKQTKIKTSYGLEASQRLETNERSQLPQLHEPCGLDDASLVQYLLLAHLEKMIAGSHNTAWQEGGKGNVGKGPKSDLRPGAPRAQPQGPCNKMWQLQKLGAAFGLVGTQASCPMVPQAGQGPSAGTIGQNR